MMETKPASSQPEKPADKWSPGLRGQWERFVASNRLILAVCLLGGFVVFVLALPGGVRQALINGLAGQRRLIGLALAFIAVNLSLLWTGGQRFDAWVYLRINHLRVTSPRLDRLMLAATQAGDGPFGFVLIVLAYLLGYPRLAVELALGVTILWMVVELLKALTSRSRPFFTVAEARLVGLQPRGRSFPSGHTSQIFFLVVVILNYFQPPGWLSLLVYALAVFVGYSRLYLGVHYPRDVLAGAVLGSLLGLIALLFDPYLASRLP